MDISLYSTLPNYEGTFSIANIEKYSLKDLIKAIVDGWDSFREALELEGVTFQDIDPSSLEQYFLVDDYAFSEDDESDIYEDGVETFHVIAKATEEYGVDSVKTQAFLMWYPDWNSQYMTVEAALKAFSESYLGSYEDLATYASEVLENTANIPSDLWDYIDLEGYYESISQPITSYEDDDHYHLFHS